MGLMVVGVVVACSDDDANTPPNNTPDSTVPVDSNQPGTDAHADDAAHADTGADSGFVPPAGCVEVTLGTLRNGTQLTPPSWGNQPRVLGNTATDIGGAVIQPTTADAGADSGMIDAGVATPAPDTFSLTVRLPTAEVPAGGALDLPVGSTGANFATCTTCARLNLDVVATGATAVFMAESGNFHMTAKVNDNQFAGTLENVVLREVEFDTSNNSTRATRPITNARCYYVRSTPVDSRVTGGCDPTKAATSCGAGKTCAAINYSATDGLCVASRGTVADNAACEPDDNGDSDCAVGSVCSYSRYVGGDYQCMKRCNINATVTGCPAGRVCSGLGQCELPTTVFNAPLQENVQLGGTCAAEQEGKACGRDGALGICTDVDAEGPLPLTCYPYATRRGDCLALPGGPWEMGYFGYKNDTSLGFCYPRFPYSF